MENIITIISQLGFPIAIAVIILYFGVKFIEGQVKQYADREDKLIAAYNANEDRFTKQIDKFNDTLCNFNITLTKIDTRLESLERKLDNTEE